MEIYLSHSTAGRYGGIQFGGILKHFDRYIQQKAKDEKFESSFEEFWLTFAYPPLYMLPQVVGMRRDFLRWYATLPESRVSRRYKKIDVTIQLPEFAEHFDLEDQKKYKNKYSIDGEYQNLGELELANILIDKYVEAIELVKPKIKATDSFDTSRLIAIVTAIKCELSRDFLQRISVEESEKYLDEILRSAIESRKTRKATLKEADKGIRDLRTYYVDLPRKSFYPYDSQYLEIFRNLLSRSDLRCPTYHHLYIQVAKNREEALRHSESFTDWYIYGIAIVDYEDYKKKNEGEKSKAVFNLICDGLFDIAEIDNLDKDLIQRTIDEIAEKGLDTELSFKEIDHKKYSLRISYLARSMEEECPIFFTIEDKDTNKKYRIEIGRADIDQIRLWLQKVSLTRKKIKVKSSESIRANVWLKNKKRRMEFELADIMIEENEYQN